MISIELSRRFKEKVRQSRREAEVLAALKLVAEGFGRPHAHIGLGIRKLGNELYECRTSLGWRLVFAAEKRRLVFDFADDHDEVQKHLRGQHFRERTFHPANPTPLPPYRSPACQDV